MPIYEYICSKCDHQFEEIVLGKDLEAVCPQCGSCQTNKLMSRCRSKMAGAQGVGEVPSASSGGGGCAGCSGGSCASCG